MFSVMTIERELARIRREQILDGVTADENARVKRTGNATAVGADVVDYIRFYPWQDVKVSSDLAIGGLSPYSADASDIAKTSAVRDLKRVANGDTTGNASFGLPAPAVESVDSGLGGAIRALGGQASFSSAYLAALEDLYVNDFLPSLELSNQLRARPGRPDATQITDAQIQDFFARPQDFIGIDKLQAKIAEHKDLQSVDRFGLHSADAMDSLQSISPTDRETLPSNTSDDELISFAQSGPDPFVRKAETNPAARAVTGALGVAGDAIGGAFKDTIRQVGSTLISPVQILQNYASNSYKEGQKLGQQIRDDSLTARSVIDVAGDVITGNQGDAFRATDLGVSIADARDPNRNLQGSGFFLGEGGVEERKRLEAKFSAYGTEGVFAGDRLTIGRQLTSIGGFDKYIGETGANILSGTLDAAVALVGPQELAVNKAIRGVARLRTLPGLRTLPVAGRVNPTQAGVLEGFWRQSDPVKAVTWLTSWRGRRVVESLSKTTNIEDVMAVFKGKIPVKMAQFIADANAPAIARLSGVSDEVAEGVAQTLISRTLEQGIGSRAIGDVPQLSMITGFMGRLSKANPTLNKIRTIERFRSIMPGLDGLDPHDVDAQYQWARSTLVNAKIPKVEREAALSALVRARTPSERISILGNDVMELVSEKTFRILHRRQRNSGVGLFKRVVGDDEAEKLIARQARKDAKELTRMFDDATQQMSLYNMDNAGLNINPFVPVVAGQRVDASAPHLLSEMLSVVIPVPELEDVRKVRRITSADNPIGALIALPLASRGGDARRLINGLEGMTQFWRRLVLLKGAYILKVVGDEQGRTAATGGDSLYNNGIGWLSWVIGRGDRGNDIFGAALDVSGVIVGPDRTIGQAAAKFASRQGEQAVGVATGMIPVAKGNPSYVEAWANNLAQLSRDTVTRMVVKDGVDATLVAIRGNPELHAKIISLGRSQADALGVNIDLGDLGDLRTWLDSIAERVQLATNGNPTLMEAIVSGKMGAGDAAFAISDSANPHALDSATDEFVQILDGMQADGPDLTKALKKTFAGNRDSPANRDFRNTLEFLGALFIQRPTSKLSRIPLFRQNYWKNVDENVELLSKDAAAKLLGQLPEGLPRSLKRSLKFKLSKASREGTGDFTHFEYDAYAKSRAMKDTNEVLVAFAEKAQWEDMLRVMAPFAQAWGEVIRTWGKILTVNPKVVLRVGQAFTVLHDEDFAELTGKVPGFDTVSGQALIYTNDFGDERISLPWAGTVSDLSASAWNNTLGRVAGRVQGRPADLPGTLSFDSPANALSIGAAVVPGLGPFSGILLSDVLDRMPHDFTSLKETLFPFGNPPDFNLIGITESTVPSYMRYMFLSLSGGETAFGTRDEQDSYNGKVAGATQWLLANGDYDLKNGGIAERNRLQDTAAEVVAWMAWTAAMSTQVGVGPSSPGFFLTNDNGEVVINTEDGGTYLTSNVASSIYRLWIDESVAQGRSFADASDIAQTRLIQEFGGGDPQFLSVIIGKSRSRLPGGTPVSRASFDWVNEDPSRISDAPDVWQFFAPRASDFYYPMYLKTIDEADRTRFNPRQFNNMVDDVVASYLFEQTASKFRIGGVILPEAAGIVAGVRDELAQSFPGWRQTADFKDRSIPQIIQQLDEVTSQGGKFADHAIAADVQTIIQMRELFNTALKESGLSTSESPFSQSQQTAPFREIYETQLQQIQTENPLMADVITSVFRAEISAGLESDLAALERIGAGQ